MLNTTYYQRNANKNNEISPHTGQNGHHQKVYKQQMLERVWRKGNTLTLFVGGNVNRYSHYGSWYGDSLKNQEQNHCMNQQSHSQAYSLRKPKLKRHMYPIIHCSSITIARTWKQPRCPLTAEWIKKQWYIHTMEYYSAV